MAGSRQQLKGPEVCFRVCPEFRLLDKLATFWANRQTYNYYLLKNIRVELLLFMAKS